MTDTYEMARLVAAAEQRESKVRELVEAAEEADKAYTEWRASRLPPFRKKFASQDDWYAATSKATEALFEAMDRLRDAIAAVREKP